MISASISFGITKVVVFKPKLLSIFTEDVIVNPNGRSTFLATARSLFLASGNAISDNISRRPFKNPDYCITLKIFVLDKFRKI